MSDVEQKADSSKWALLGFARFVLAFVVMTGHISSAITMWHGWTKWGLWLNQGSAVFGFLLISGYSIAASLEKNTDRFYVRRIGRIYPIYLVAILFSLAVCLLSQDQITFPNGDVISMPVASQVVAAVFMLQTIVSLPIATNGPLWTLAIEWWNYMLAPLLKKAPSLLIALLAAASLEYDIHQHPSDVSRLVHGQTFLCISWYWLVGFLYYRHRRTPWGYVLLFLPVLMAYSSDIFVGRAVIVGLLAIALCDEIRISSNLIKLMNWLGDISYPIYVFQIPVMLFCTFWHVTYSLVVCAVTVVISAIVHSWFEVPVRKLWMQKLGSGRKNKPVTTDGLEATHASTT